MVLFYSTHFLSKTNHNFIMASIAQPQIVVSKPRVETFESKKKVVTPGISLISGAIGGAVEATATVSTAVLDRSHVLISNSIHLNSPKQELS